MYFLWEKFLENQGIIVRFYRTILFYVIKGSIIAQFHVSVSSLVMVHSHYQFLTSILQNLLPVLIVPDSGFCAIAVVFLPIIQYFSILF
jgi:hypothetical protein